MAKSNYNEFNCPPKRKDAVLELLPRLAYYTRSFLHAEFEKEGRHGA